MTARTARPLLPSPPKPEAGRRPTRLLAALALAATLGGTACTSPALQPDPIDAEVLAEEESLLSLLRLHKLMQELEAAPPDVNATFTVLNTLERLMPSWETHQRTLSEEPLEGVLMRTVVAHFDGLVEQLRHGAHERRVVAAWAMGFSRVPERELVIDGEVIVIASRHEEAVEELVALLDDASDDILRNAMVALWKLAEPSTPVAPLCDVVVNHHDGLVRANATLALGAILRPETASAAQDATLVALSDSEPKVRLHAASIARRFSTPAYTRRIEQIIPDEEMARIRANMAAALGAARSRTSAPVLVPLLDSPRVIESTMAHQALVTIFGDDLGDDSEDWEGVLP